MNDETRILWEWLLAHPGPGSLGWFKGMVDGAEPAVGAERLREWTWDYAPLKVNEDGSDYGAYASLLKNALQRVEWEKLAIELAALPDGEGGEDDEEE